MDPAVLFSDPAADGSDLFEVVDEHAQVAAKRHSLGARLASRSGIRALFVGHLCTELAVPVEIAASSGMGALEDAAVRADLPPLRGKRVHLSFICLQLAAFLAVLAAVVGTDRLGRPLTNEERKRFGALLEAHDYEGNRLIALRFAFKLTRSEPRAQDLTGRADLRLVRFGWDPAEVPLVDRLCRLVWSEWTHEASETEAARKAAQAFMLELEAGGWKLVPPKKREVTEAPKADDDAHWAVASHEETAMGIEAQREALTKAAVKLERLRVVFEKAGDEVNLLWLRYQMEDVYDLQKMAQQSGRPVEDLYAAAKRRRRAVQRLLANDRGVDWKEETKEGDEA